MRYLAYCSFVGTNYIGWQRQPNGTSVQSVIETALGIFFRTPVRVTGCGRTDAGVHAREYAFHFDTDGEFEPGHFIFKVNKLLPLDVVIHSIDRVDENFHARFSAVSRRYIYRIHTSKDPFIRTVSWYLDRLSPSSLDTLNETAAIIGSLTDFSSFAKTGSDNKTNLCTMLYCHWECEGSRLELHIEANRFLRGMVRLIVGGCVNVAVDKLDMARLKELALIGQMLPYAFSVPAHGLTFEGVRF